MRHQEHSDTVQRVIADILGAETGEGSAVALDAYLRETAKPSLSEQSGHGLVPRRLVKQVEVAKQTDIQEDDSRCMLRQSKMNCLDQVCAQRDNEVPRGARSATATSCGQH